MSSEIQEQWADYGSGGRQQLLCSVGHEAGAPEEASRRSMLLAPKPQGKDPFLQSKQLAKT